MLRTFETEKEIYEEFQNLCRREGVRVGFKINSLMKAEIFKHKEQKNPQTDLDLFDNTLALAIPHLFEEDKDTWVKFYSRINIHQYKDLGNSIERLKKMHEAHKILF